MADWFWMENEKTTGTKPYILSRAIAIDLREKGVKSMRYFLLVLLLSLSTGNECAITSPIYGQQFSPPSVYEQYWREIKECSGLQGDYSRLEWYRTEDGSMGKGIMGRWDYQHRITLTEFVVTREVAVSIKHEMLHDLLQSGEHPAVFYTCGVIP